MDAIRRVAGPLFLGAAVLAAVGVLLDSTAGERVWRLLALPLAVWLLAFLLVNARTIFEPGADLEEARHQARPQSWFRRDTSGQGMGLLRFPLFVLVLVCVVLWTVGVIDF